MIDANGRERISKAHADESFAKFMSAPLTRVVTAMIPKGETADALAMLLRAAFDAGFCAGESDVVVQIIAQIRDGGPHRAR